MFKKIKIKICGLKYYNNISSIIDLSPDFIGLIFFEKSPRFVGDNFLAPDTIGISKVGVFVNEKEDKLLKLSRKNNLDFVQLHGDESPYYCRNLYKKGIKIIKSFGIDNNFYFEKIKEYIDHVKYFLFDFKSKIYGGSGKKFFWEKIYNYNLKVPFLLSGGINSNDFDKINNLNIPNLLGIDLNSCFENKPGLKNLNLLKKFISRIKYKYLSDYHGFYGNFGGAYIPEMLYNNINNLKNEYNKIINNNCFKKKLKRLLHNYVGRPSPLFYCNNLSKIYGAKIYLKREDLNHTGSHKINNTIGQALLAKEIGKKNIISETGAGQHGVATSTICSLLGLKCTIFMGEVDIKRQIQNVYRMKMLGANIIAVNSGSKTLKDSVNEAIRYWINNPDCYYMIGSAVGPDPYPRMVSYFQSIISEEIKEQLKEKESGILPNYIIACLGGGSNAAGIFYHFLDDEYVKLIGVEASGLGLNTNKTAATIQKGSRGVLHGSMTILMQDKYGQILEPYSISAGLDYPGIGPMHANLFYKNRATFISVTDFEAIEAGIELSSLEGIIPALESAHAIASLKKLSFKKNDLVIINMSGRGDKDMDTYIKHIENK
ncbi:bifunctional phosphoribosylanthranilate isomerase/tryptophan synthase subunit beta [Candidatus Karelsulcia muelleri]|uniref:Multifunctional fusion protein n=1 Tax=Candidatus Karelsulcia muelleri TaxID=336810 RepID=A0A3A1MKL3_9FLAO|nr:bifunctional phosphoribosylanthranilate isomerase/tryptophan synthase subunit beta [Candidatus Karelsulcia muelleri]RIU86157.1 bifunctional phosphoribosylanthranilate isomerase/tryptophan synthase subunit beta [Candidatus Karelsulcia muelleri]